MKEPKKVITIVEAQAKNLDPIELDIWRVRSKPLRTAQGEDTNWRFSRWRDGYLLIHAKQVQAAAVYVPAGVDKFETKQVMVVWALGNQ